MIAFEKVGTGPSLVLVDGALCYREFGLCCIFSEHLADRFTMYFYDRRGRGESGPTDGPSAAPYAPQGEYKDLAAVISAVARDAFVADFSSGTPLALPAEASSVKMCRLTLYEAPCIGLKQVKGVKAG